MQPDLEPKRMPLIPVAAEIVCPNCGYTILTYDRELTEAEVRDSLDRTIEDLQAKVDRLARKLEVQDAMGHPRGPGGDDQGRAGDVED